jgi:hypothetical protein
MATAELAVAMPVLVAVLALALSALAAGVDQVRCVDAARTGARLMARGEPQGRVLADVRQVAPPGAEFATSTASEEVTVSVVAQPSRVLRWLGLTVRPAAQASAAREDVAVGPGPGP